MNKHTIITIIAIAVILIPFITSGLNIYGVEQLEYRWHGPGEFSLFTMSNHGEIEFCNVLPFWTSFQRYEIAMFFEENHLGSFVVGPLGNNPFASAVKEGVFSSEKLSASQHVFMTMDFELNGGDIRLDPNRFVMVTKVDTPIIGLIPFSTTKQFDIVDFDNLMNAEDLTCD